MKKTKAGVIYILTNPSFNEYIKIGYADDVEKRLKQLNSSPAIPYAFRVYAIYEVEGRLTDKELHKLIDTLNPGLRTIETFDGKERVKEFYAMSPEEGYSLLESIAKISGTQKKLKRMKPEGHEILEEKQAKEIEDSFRRGPFKFSMCGIKTGEEVAFIRNPKKKAVVVDDSHVEFEGETTSLSALAQRLLKQDYPAQGPIYFTYKGKKLSDIRLAKEKM